MICTACGRRIASRSSDGKVRIRTSILVFGPDGKAEVVCPRCKCDTDVDVLPGDSIRRELTAPMLVLPVVRKTS